MELQHPAVIWAAPPTASGFAPGANALDAAASTCSIRRGAGSREHARPRLALAGLAGMLAVGCLAFGAVTSPGGPLPVAAAVQGSPAYPGHLLQTGSRGADVAAVQRALRLRADGIFGPRTLAAVRAFQSRHGLGVDGIVGPATWAALFPASAPAAPGSTGGSSGAHGAATRGQSWTVDTVLTRPSGVDAAAIGSWVRAHHPGSPLASDGSAFMEAEQRYGVNAQYLLAHAFVESAWGTSAIARNDNNLFGFTAYDSNPGGSATHFASHRDSILTVARYVKAQYLTAGGRYYVAPTLRGMNVHYATDPSWASNIASVASSMRGMGGPSTPQSIVLVSSGGSAQRRSIASIAMTQVGVGESPPGSNCTGYGACEAWCSDFATWVWQHAGVPVPHFPYSGDVGAWGSSTGRLRPSNQRPQTGDVLLWGSWAQSNHISVVMSVDGSGGIHTVDGNWGNRVATRTVTLQTIDPSDGPIYAVVSPQPLRGAGGGGSVHPGGSHPYPGTVLLQGSTGPTVAEVQRALGIAADGIFGPITRAAVVSFQSAHHLSADGVVGPVTWAALFPAG